MSLLCGLMTTSLTSGNSARGFPYFCTIASSSGTLRSDGCGDSPHPNDMAHMAMISIQLLTAAPHIWAYRNIHAMALYRPLVASSTA
jgi:hypothetical protein